MRPTADTGRGKGPAVQPAHRRSEHALTKLYLCHRVDDDPGFVLHMASRLEALVPHVAVVRGPVPVRGIAPAPPPDATVLLLVGQRWLAPTTDGLPYLAEPHDPLRAVLRAAESADAVVVPVVFRARPWSAICAALPGDVGPGLARLNAATIRHESFDADLILLLTDLQAPHDGPWTETAVRTVVEVRAERGGALKWYANSDKAIRVYIDGTEVGALGAWGKRTRQGVEPGPHTVQVRHGTRAKDGPSLGVDVEHGETVNLLCGRNIFTGRLSLERR